jgi:hypothetical protein
MAALEVAGWAMEDNMVAQLCCDTLHRARAQRAGSKTKTSLRLKWSDKFGQRAKMYPTLINGYENDEATEFFRQV